MKRAAWLSALCCVVMAVLAPRPACAHDLDSGALRLRERAPGRYAVTWAVRDATRLGEPLRPVFPEHCREASSQQTRRVGSTTQSTWLIDCRPAGLTGRIAVSGFVGSVSSVVLRIEHASGSVETALLHASAPSYPLGAQPCTNAAGGLAPKNGKPLPSLPSPCEKSSGPLAHRLAAFGRLGLEHIASGIDHVLFVLALALWIRGARRLAMAVTGFTLGHSITLALSTLGWIQVPAAPIEVLIALSIAFVAAEWLRSARGPSSTLSERHPWLPAMGFGLFHGLGFAGALTDLGLSGEALPVALLGFNLGVEAGQLAIVAAVVAARAAARHIETPAWLIRAGAYAIGTIAAFWTVERLEGLWVG